MHFVQWSGTVLAILVHGHERNFCEIMLRSIHQLVKNGHSIFFLILALVTFLLSGVESFYKYRYKVMRAIFL